MKIKHKLIIVIVFAILVGWYSLFLISPINLATADLGRHIKNGEMVLAGQFDVLYSNFYSYTEPNFSFVNHHWLSGVVFYIVESFTGFTGIAIFHSLLLFTTLLIIFFIARKLSSIGIASIIIFCCVPLLAYRAEIRPETFTYLFSAIFLFILIHYEYYTLNKKWLISLPVMTLFWVNLHLGFIFAIMFVGVFLFENIVEFFIQKKKVMPTTETLYRIKTLFYVLGATIMASLINPNFYRGLLEPFMIFREYGYDIVEHKSIQFLINYGLENPIFLLAKILIILLAVSFSLQIIFSRREFKLSLFIIAAVFSTLALLVVRNISHFAFFAIPILSYNIFTVYESLKRLYSPYYSHLIFGSLAIIAIIFIFLYNFESLENGWQTKKLGIYQNINRSAEFFKSNNIAGPIFNNYDIGGYLIYHLFPEYKVFTDNRPEAYSYKFFKETYIPMQEDENKWHKVDSTYGFNAIFFYRHDYTPWGQNFLITRASDDDWVAVYVDTFNIIFVKNSPQNSEVIKKYGLSKEIFGIKTN